MLIEPTEHCGALTLRAPGEELAMAYEASSATCAAADGTMPFFAVGEPLSLDVLASLTRRQGGSRLRSNAYVDAGGTVVMLDSYPFHDDELGFDCLPYHVGDAGLRCLPRARQLFTDDALFSDPACSDPVGVAIASCGQPVTHFVWQVEAATCSTAPAFRAPSDVTDEVYRREGGQCVAATVPDGHHAFTLAPLAIDTLPPLTLEVR